MEITVGRVIRCAAIKSDALPQHAITEVEIAGAALPSAFDLQLTPEERQALFPARGKPCERFPRAG